MLTDNSVVSLSIYHHIMYGGHSLKISIKIKQSCLIVRKGYKNAYSC